MFTLIILATITVWIVLIGMLMIAMNSIQSDHFHSMFTSVRVTAIMLTMITLIGIIT